MATGQGSGIFVLDVDGQAGSDSLVKWDSDGLLIPNTLRVETSRGSHLYFAWPTEGAVRNSASKLAPGVDVRGEGGYVIAPPSVHESGHTYKFFDPALVPDNAPGWLLHAIAQAHEATCHGICENRDAIPKGKRNDVLTSLAGTMRRRGMTVSAIEAALLEENRAQCKPPLLDAEVRDIARSASRYKPVAPKQEVKLIRPELLTLSEVEAREVDWLWSFISQGGCLRC